LNLRQTQEQTRILFERAIQRGSMTNKLLAEKTKIAPTHICNFRHARRRLSVEALSELSPRSASSWKSFQSGAHKPQDGPQRKEAYQGRRERPEESHACQLGNQPLQPGLRKRGSCAGKKAGPDPHSGLASAHSVALWSEDSGPGFQPRPYRLPPGCPAHKEP